MKKILKITGIVLLLVIVAGSLFVYFSGPSLPPGNKEKIKLALQSEVPELKGEQGFAKNGETQIWYEVLSPKDSVKGNILLIMGIANDALAWPDYFIDPLVEKGYKVIRFDNRGTGLTDWGEDWDKENPYSFEDMADDGIAVLDTLGIKKAHVVGISLGGMIGQTMTIQHPERVQTLTSIMSSGYIMDKELPGINTSLVKDMVLAGLKFGLVRSEKNQLKLQLVARQLLQGSTKYDLAVEDVAQTVLYNLRKRKGYNSKASEQQIAATIKSGSRYEALAKLTTPTLVIHGKTDPLIPFEHGLKCAEIIPNADSLWLEGMGHDIPKMFVEEIIEKITGHIK